MHGRCPRADIRTEIKGVILTLHVKRVKLTTSVFIYRELGMIGMPLFEIEEIEHRHNRCTFVNLRK